MVIKFLKRQTVYILLQQAIASFPVAFDWLRSNMPVRVHPKFKFQVGHSTLATDKKLSSKSTKIGIITDYKVL